MIQGVNTTDKYSVHFNICTDDERGLLWLEVRTFEAGKPRTKKDFSGAEYGEAVAYYKRRQEELKKQYCV